jgi:serine/threonine protein kinase
MLCDGVSAAHQHLITHRDRKPKNIIINPNNQAVLTDIGLAKDLGAAEVGHRTSLDDGVLIGRLWSTNQIFISKRGCSQNPEATMEIGFGPRKQRF